MKFAQAVRESSLIILLGPQEQCLGRYTYGLDSLQLDGLRIGAQFVEFTIGDNSQAVHYMYSLDDCTLINVW